MVQRVAEAVVRLALDECGALIDRVQAEDHPHRGGLPGPVRPHQTGHHTGTDGKGHAVEGQGRPISLAQSVDDNPRALIAAGSRFELMATVVRGTRFQPGRSRCDPAETWDLASLTHATSTRGPVRPPRPHDDRR
ncbi:hypothetical protein SVIO_024660 [Streptomyces violaceusniger]|uniref:Uncharacterized protein n=1 Tax=Streptomyces violaceusniger TaxID=68280 RepID=A0A4D4L1I2_STRVO|nr:hypothetical protein SVIO_024660 [Streptomyces violaceusniger]